jgi:hypothetical protein
MAQWTKRSENNFIDLIYFPFDHSVRENMHHVHVDG